MRALALIVALMSALWAGVYDYSYSPAKEVPIAEQNHTFFYGDFDRILRYPPIQYEHGLGGNFNQDLDKVIRSVKTYTEVNGSMVKLSVIAHTRTNDDLELEYAQETTRFGKVQNESYPDPKTNIDACNEVLDAVKKRLVKEGIKDENIVLDCRAGADSIYLEDDEDARKRNYNVRITLYQYTKK